MSLTGDQPYEAQLVSKNRILAINSSENLWLLSSDGWPLHRKNPWEEPETRKHRKGLLSNFASQHMSCFPKKKKSPNKKKLSYTYQIHKSSFLPWKASRILTAKTSLASTAYPARHQPDGGAMVSQPTAKRFIGAPKWSAEMPCWQETCRSTKTAFGAKGSISKYRNKWAQSYLDGKIKKCRIVFFCCAPKMCKSYEMSNFP